VTDTNSICSRIIVQKWYCL